MTAYTQNGSYLPHGVNEQNIAMVETIVAVAMANTDTMAVQLPGGNGSVSPAGEPNTVFNGDQFPVDWDSIPVLLQAWNPTVTPGVPLTTIGLTSHNVSTGV